MKYFSVLNISFYQIHIFLATAERESITQAAQYLNVSQSMVSKNIKQMEENLGLYLFIREKQTLRLTPAGKLLMNEFSSIYSKTSIALEHAHALQAVESKPVVIGIPDSSNLKKFFLDTKEHLSQKDIHIAFHIECLPFGQLEQCLQNKTIDIVITCGFDIDSFSHPTLTCFTIPVGPYYAYMCPQNELSRKPFVTMKELQSYPFLMVSPIETPSYNQLVLSLCNKAGFSPLISKYVSSPNSFICNFDTGNEIFIADSYMRESENRQLCRVAIQDTDSTISIIRRRKNDNLDIPYIFTEITVIWREQLAAGTL